MDHVFIETKGSRDFTSSWTHPQCDHDGRWSLCADRAHADCRRERGKKGIEFKFYSDIRDQRTDELMSDQILPPEVPETTVSPDLLQSLQIFSQLVVQAVSEDLKQDEDTAAVTSELTLQFKSGLD